ncbi:hypothetical protein RHS03_08061, partial [Rhizoctonia solani]
MKLLTVSWMFAGAACVFGAPVSFGEVESRHENKERHANIQYIGNESITIGTRDVSLGVTGNFKVPQPYPVEKIVYKDRPVPVPVPVEKIVENIVYKDRQVPVPTPVEVIVEGGAAVQSAD